MAKRIFTSNLWVSLSDWSVETVTTDVRVVGFPPAFFFPGLT